jgi:hypothetical protein
MVAFTLWTPSEFPWRVLKRIASKCGLPRHVLNMLGLLTIPLECM